MASDFTAYYQLDKYVATDKPNLRDQYNSAMNKIDTAMHSIDTAATAAAANANAVAAALPSASFDSTNTVAAALAGKAAAADVTELQGMLPAASFDSTNTVAAALATKASASDLTSLQGTVSSINNALPLTQFDSTNTVYSNFNKINTFLGLKETILVLGDSWTNPLDGRWQTAWLKNIADLDTRVKSFGVNGAESSNLSTQLQNAINDTSFDNKTVTTIVIIVGLNDYRHSVSADMCASNINGLATTIRTNMPHAKVVVLTDTFSPYPSTAPFDSTHDFLDNKYHMMYIFSSRVAQTCVFPVYWLGLYLNAGGYFETNAQSGNSGFTFHLNNHANTLNIMRQIFYGIVNSGQPTANVQYTDDSGWIMRGGATGDTFVGSSDHDPNAGTVYYHFLGSGNAVDAYLNITIPTNTPATTEGRYEGIWQRGTRGTSFLPQCYGWFGTTIRPHAMGSADPIVVGCTYACCQSQPQNWTHVDDTRFLWTVWGGALTGQALLMHLKYGNFNSIGTV